MDKSSLREVEEDLFLLFEPKQILNLGLYAGLSYEDWFKTFTFFDKVKIFFGIKDKVEVMRDRARKLAGISGELDVYYFDKSFTIGHFIASRRDRNIELINYDEPPHGKVLTGMGLYEEDEQDKVEK